MRPLSFAMDSKALPNIVILGVLWGTNLVVARLGIGQFDAVLFVGLRLALASLGFVLGYLVMKRRLPKDRQFWRHAVMLGIFGTALPMTVTISSLQFQSSGVAALLLTATPAIVVLMAHFMLPDEKLNRYKGAGILLALGGALLLILRRESGLPDVSTANPIGYLLILSGMLSESRMAIYVRKHMQNLDPFDVTSVRLGTAALLVLPLALLWRGADFSQVTTVGVTALIFTAMVGALGGQLMSFYVTKRFGALAFSMTSYIIPLVAAITGVILLNEVITSGMTAGMLLIGLGITLINRFG